MICLNCGKHVDDDVRVCPFCGSAIEATDTMPLDDAEEGPIPVTLNGRHPAAETRTATADAGAARGFESERRKNSFFTPAFVLSLFSFVLSLLCLLMIMSLRGGVAELSKAMTESLGAVNTAVSQRSPRPAGYHPGRSPGRGLQPGGQPVHFHHKGHHAPCRPRGRGQVQSDVHRSREGQSERGYGL